MDTRATSPRGRRPCAPARGTKIVLGAVTVVAALGLFTTACSQGSSGPGVASAASSSSSAAGASSPGSMASAGPLALARCMRSHGLHDFPDPDSNGEFDLSGKGDLDQTNPAYQAAARACGSSGAGKAGSRLTPQQIAATVDFARCMRSHGIANYPDPDSNGNIPGIRHYGIEPNSAQFHTAENACEHIMRGVPGW